MFDVRVERMIAAPADTVGAVLFDPERGAEWMGGVDRVQLLTPDPYAVGAQVRREGSLLGRSIGWITETTRIEAGCEVEMRIVEGPFAGDVVYALLAAPGGSRVSIRVRGRMPLMPDVVAGVMVRGSLAGDLKRLDAIVTRNVRESA